MTSARLSPDGSTLVVRVPMQFRRIGGRKQIVTPDGAPPWAPRSPRIDSALVKALARAHRWRRKLESGEYGTIRELAVAEKLNESYVSRILRLTLLAPDTIEAILDGRAPASLTLAMLMQPFPTLWREQVEARLRRH